jgi:hypothetical protein
MADTLGASVSTANTHPGFRTTVERVSASDGPAADLLQQSHSSGHDG